MDGVSDAAFRLTVAEHGRPDVMFTEFTSVGDICRGPDLALASLRYHESERPIVAQLYGKDPDLYYQAAHVVCALGFDGLDINMGCPSHNVASSGSGAGLIRTPARAHDIMRAARQGIADWHAGQSLEQAGIKATRANLIRMMNQQRGGPEEPLRRLIPLSVKTRLGYDAIVVEDWVAHLLELRPAVISLHGRTLSQMYRGSADWDAIGRASELVHRSGISGQTLVLGNGDLQSLADVVSRVQASGVDGVLVGRGTLGSPWFFAPKEMARAACSAAAVSRETLLRGMMAGSQISLAERFGVMVAHAQLFETVAGVQRFPSMRKHLGWYCKGFPHAAALRARMVRASSSVDVAQIVTDYLADTVPSSPASAANPQDARTIDPQPAAV